MVIHKQLAAGRWFELLLIEQLANVGSDVIRAIRWKNKGYPAYSERAFDRALELIDFTVKDAKNKGRLKEILRVREALVDYFMYNNEYNSSDELWERYFYYYNYAAALKRGV